VDPASVSPEQLYGWTDACPERTELSSTVAEQVRNTERYMKRGILLGWFTGADFRRLLCSSDVTL